MAQLDASHCQMVYEDVGPRKWALFALRNVSGNDTLDFTALGHFARVRKAVLMGCTTDTALPAPGVQDPATVALPSGLAGDAAYLLVDGIGL